MSKEFIVNNVQGIGGLLYHHRRQLNDGQLVLLTNTSLEQWSTGTIRVKGASVISLNALDGSMKPYPAAVNGEMLSLGLQCAAGRIAPALCRNETGPASGGGRATARTHTGPTVWPNGDPENQPEHADPRLLRHQAPERQADQRHLFLSRRRYNIQIVRASGKSVEQSSTVQVRYPGQRSLPERIRVRSDIPSRYGKRNRPCRSARCGRAPRTLGFESERHRPSNPSRRNSGWTKRLECTRSGNMLPKETTRSRWQRHR